MNLIQEPSHGFAFLLEGGPHLVDAVGRVGDIAILNAADDLLGQSRLHVLYLPPGDRADGSAHDTHWGVCLHPPERKSVRRCIPCNRTTTPCLL